MKKILDGLAALANEADAEGNVRAADQIDGLIKVLAALDPVGEQLDKEHLEESQRKSQAALLSKKKEDKKQEILKMHERARVILQDVANMFKDAGEESPIKVPSAAITGTQILDALKLANMGSPLTGWGDLMKRLNNLKAQVASHFSVGTPNPFGNAEEQKATVPSEIEHKHDPGTIASIPTPNAGSGAATLDTGSKGPPRAPSLK